MEIRTEEKTKEYNWVFAYISPRNTSLVNPDTFNIMQLDHNDILRVSLATVCEANGQIYFYGLILSINGVLLMFGAFLAWETRHVTVKALNDSRYIGEQMLFFLNFDIIWWYIFNCLEYYSIVSEATI